MASKGKIYAVMAVRYGDKSCHHYLVGIYNKKHAAILAAEEEENERGGKYSCDVYETDFGEKIPDKIVREGKNFGWDSPHSTI